jgi:hypothetical protein
MMSRASPSTPSTIERPAAVASDIFDRITILNTSDLRSSAPHRLTPIRQTCAPWLLPQHDDVGEPELLLWRMQPTALGAITHHEKDDPRIVAQRHGGPQNYVQPS